MSVDFHNLDKLSLWDLACLHTGQNATDDKPTNETRHKLAELITAVYANKLWVDFAPGTDFDFIRGFMPSGANAKVHTDWHALDAVTVRREAWENYIESQLPAQFSSTSITQNFYEIDDHWSIQEAAQQIGTDEIGIYERFLDGRLMPSVYFINPVPAIRTKVTSRKDLLDENGRLKAGEADVIQELNRVWDLRLYDDTRLYGGNRFIVESRLNELKHNVTMTPRETFGVFVQRGNDILLLKARSDNGFYTPEDIPSDARLVVRKTELEIYSNRIAVKPASGKIPQDNIAMSSMQPSAAMRLHVIDISAEQPFVLAENIPNWIAEKLEPIPETLPVLCNLQKRMLIDVNHWKIDDLTPVDWTLLDKIWRHLPEVQGSNIERFADYRQAFESSADKPIWDLHAEFQHLKEEAKTRQANIRHQHFWILNEAIKNRTLKAFTRERVPATALEPGVLVPTEDARAYLRKLGFDLREAGTVAPIVAVQVPDPTMTYCYWSSAAIALAERQTIESDDQAKAILRRQGGYLAPSSGDWFPFPAPEPSADLLAKYPHLGSEPRDSNAKLKLLHHRAKTYENILEALRDAGEIEFYEPGTHLRITNASKIVDPVVYLDKIGKQVKAYSSDKGSIQNNLKTEKFSSSPISAPPKNAEDQKHDQPKYKWIVPVQNLAIQEYKKAIEQGWGSDQKSISEIVAKLCEEKIYTDKGKVLTAKTILRHALTPWEIPKLELADRQKQIN